MKSIIAALIAILSITSSLRADILAGPITNSANNHVYLLLTTNTWGIAEQEAVALGGHLTTINNNKENQFVHTNFSNFGGVDRILWIGLTDKGVEGTFNWINGEDATYRNWASGEPNDSSGGENRVGMWPSDGTWNDFTGATSSGFGVVEIIPGVAAQVSIYGAVEIAWTTQTTNTYQIQWSSALNSNSWFNLDSPIQGTGNTNYYFDTTRSTEKRFYRVLTLQP